MAVFVFSAVPDGIATVLVFDELTNLIYVRVGFGCKCGWRLQVG